MREREKKHMICLLRWLNSVCCLSHSEGEYGRKTRTIQADFTEGNAVYPAIAQELHGLEIGILGKRSCGYQAALMHQFCIATEGISCIL